MTREELNEEIHKEIDEEERKEKRKRIIKFAIKTILLLTIFITVFYFYTTYISTLKIEVNETRIIHEKIPSSFDGVKIIQFSDLHYGSTIYQEEVKKIKNLINERNPDLVFYTGDLINKGYTISSEEQEELTKQLSEIHASLGKYAILGDEDSEQISTIFNQSGFTILRNQSEFIYNGSQESILLIGLSSLKRNQDIEAAYHYLREENHNTNLYIITLIHEPDVVDNILSTYPTDLFLAGHSHNGTIRIPFIEKGMIKKENAINYNQAYYELNNSKLYISSGLGTQASFRLFCRPSINFFRLSNK